jgi:uncharacterized small protein (DUF1192 family)
MSRKYLEDILQEAEETGCRVEAAKVREWLASLEAEIARLKAEMKALARVA